jgi:hypothetical protein
MRDDAGAEGDEPPCFDRSFGEDGAHLERDVVEDARRERPGRPRVGEIPDDPDPERQRDRGVDADIEIGDASRHLVGADGV